ncbi:MAG: TolC family protein [Bacteroidetes bacterium]|nr:MAG: TolC family protein [Bacteroidota bacterium]
MQTKPALIIILFFFALLVRPAFTQTTWSLQDCIEYAMKHNIEIKLQHLNEQDAEYSLQQSYANFLPDLNANFRQGYSFGRSVDPFTNEFSTERIMRQNANAASSVVLFSGFQNVNYLRYHLLRNTAMRYDTEKLQNDIVLTIAAAYMQILYSEDFVETAIQQTEIIEQQLARTRALFEGGTLPRGSVLEIEARLAEEELNLITARNNLRMAYLELIQILDLDPADAFSIERPEAEMTDRLLLDDPEAVFEKALLVQPAIKSAHSRILMAEKQISLDRGRMSPSLFLNADLNTGYSEASTRFSRVESAGQVQIGYLADQTPVFTQDFRNVFEQIPYRDQIRDNFSQYVGLSLRIPIFNRWEVRTRIQQSRVALDRAQNQYELTRNNLNKAIQQAHADALAAFQKYQATVKSLDAFSESFNYTRQRFDLGMVSSVEFNESQTRVARAEREALQAKYDFIFKMKIMEFYMGEGFNL